MTPAAKSIRTVRRGPPMNPLKKVGVLTMVARLRSMRASSAARSSLVRPWFCRLVTSLRKRRWYFWASTWATTAGSGMRRRKRFHRSTLSFTKCFARDSALADFLKKSRLAQTRLAEKLLLRLRVSTRFLRNSVDTVDSTCLSGWATLPSRLTKLMWLTALAR